MMGRDRGVRLLGDEKPAFDKGELRVSCWHGVPWVVYDATYMLPDTTTYIFMFG
jgi:hypothetical protein